ncbi:MAG TPA: bifunctional oligoribonuclease/PAP phosphatase NrnA [Thermodesulfovibrionales bacterium]|nr:bifunctional oligoribonuclease/PAP phosphatase NrnA [Thermodesulfovibrionales bacterium]
MDIPDRLIQFIVREHKFFIATHVRPEGDALGSSLALSIALESMGKETTLYDRDPVPAFYRFLPCHERFTQTHLPLAHDGLPLLLLDCNEPERAGLENVVIRRSAVIDHHETIKEFGDIQWIEPHAAATGIMVYDLIRKLGVRITKDIATNLYTAIAIDTGTFRFSNTTSDVLRIAAELVESGADPGAIAGQLYETWSRERFSLLTKVLDTLEITRGIAVIVVTNEMFSETGTSPEDTENFSNFPKMMEETKVSLLLREIEGGWKVSLRSKGDWNVAKIAAQFRGGGHRNAAGCVIKGDLRAAKERLIKALHERCHQPE